MLIIANAGGKSKGNPRRRAGFSARMRRKRRADSLRCPPRVMLKALLMVFDELHDRADSLEVLDFAVGNFNLELILNAHDQIDNGEGVRIQIIDEIGILS